MILIDYLNKTILMIDMVNSHTHSTNCLKLTVETLQGVSGSGENGVQKYSERGHRAKKTTEQGAKEHNLGSIKFWVLYQLNCCGQLWVRHMFCGRDL